MFVFDGDKMYSAGSMYNERGYICCDEGTVTTVSRIMYDDLGSNPHMYFNTYKLVDNKMVEVHSGTCEPLNEGEPSQFGIKMEFTRWE